jgi:hypothetical protein
MQLAFWYEIVKFLTRMALRVTVNTRSGFYKAPFRLDEVCSSRETGGLPRLQALAQMDGPVRGDPFEICTQASASTQAHDESKDTFLRFIILPKKQRRPDTSSWFDPVSDHPTGTHLLSSQRYDGILGRCSPSLGTSMWSMLGARSNGLLQYLSRPSE